MTQSDLFLSNQPGASFRAELNQIIESLATNSAGTAAPSPTFPSQWWADYTANMLKRRRKDNTAWIDVSPIDEALLKATSAEVLAGTEATKAVTPASLRIARGGAHDCRWEWVSTTVAYLKRYGGSLLTIDDKPETIPVGGVFWTPIAGSVGVNPLYIYAGMVGGVMTLYEHGEAPVIDPRNGMPVHPSSSARTLVGQAYVIAGPAMTEGPNWQTVSSYWNRIRKSVFWSQSVVTGSTTLVPLHNPVQFLVWWDDAPQFNFEGYSQNNTAGTNISQLILDGAAFGIVQMAYMPVANATAPIGIAAAQALAIGKHTMQFGAQVSGGSGTFTGVISISVMG